MSLSRFYPVPLPPDGKLPPDQQQAQEEGQHVGNGAASRAPSRPNRPDSRIARGIRNTPCRARGNGKGGYRPADPLKERGGGQMQAVQEEGGHIQPEAVLGTVQVEGLSETNSIPICRGKQLEHEEPHPRNYQGDGGGRAEGLPHPKKMLRPEVVTVDRLYGGRRRPQTWSGQSDRPSSSFRRQRERCAAVHAGCP